MLIGDVTPGSVFDTIPGIDPSLDWQLRQANSDTNSTNGYSTIGYSPIGSDPFFIQSSQDMQDPALAGHAISGLGGVAPARDRTNRAPGDDNASQFSGDIVGVDDQGNIWTQDDNGDYYRNGQTVDIGWPAVRASLIQAKKNGPTGVGPEGGSQFSGDIVGVDDQGNIWTQDDRGYYYRNGQTVDISAPNIRASLTQAKKNGPTGVGPEGGSGQSAGSAEAQRLQNALFQRELSYNPNLQVGFDATTGRSFLVDTQTGERTDVGQTDFASIDPALQFQEDTRQFDTTNDRLRQALGLELANTDTQRAELGQNADVSNQGADQFRFEQLRQILSNPSDFLARAFMQRGEQSPFGQVTQADLINALRTEIRDVQAPQYELGVKDLYNQGQADPVVQPQVPINPVAPAIAEPKTFEQAKAESPDIWAQMQSRLSPAQGGTMGLAEGGTTRASRFITGDRVDGVPTGNEEMILNPEKAPIKVVPNPNNVPHMARGTETETDQLFRLMGLLKRPEQLQRLIEQLKLQKKSADQGGGDTIDPSRTQGRGPGGAPRFALGTLAGTVTQDQVNQYAQDFSPPAVNNLFNGGQGQSDLRFGFSLFTPQQLQQLTGDEQQALNARLGAQFNTTLDDVVKSQSQRFGATRQRQRGRLQL